MNMKASNAISKALLALALCASTCAFANDTLISRDTVNLKYTQVRDVACSVDNININMGGIRQYKEYRYETTITGKSSNDLTVNIYPITDAIDNIAVGSDAKLNITTSNSKYFVNNRDGGKCKSGSQLAQPSTKDGCHIAIPVKKGGAFAIPVSFNVKVDGEKLSRITNVSGSIPVQVSVDFNE